MPELGIGVAVLANTDSAGQAICQVVSGDVYERLLGVEGHDRLPGLVREVQRERARPSSSVPPEANPATAQGALGLAPERYVGAFGSAQWGTLRVTLEDGVLIGRLGNVHLSLHTLGKERFLAYAPGTVSSEARFVVADGGVSAIEADLSGRAVTFERVH